MTSGAAEGAHVSPQRFEELFHAVSAWGRWGKGDERGALNHLTPERAVAAGRLVREGLSITLARPLDTEAEVDNPKPAEHRMTKLPSAPGPKGFATDYVGVEYHADAHTHIDALCHVAYRGRLYNGAPVDGVTSDGALVESIEVLRNGLVGRGVLLDIPRLRGVPWLEPGEHVFADDLERAEAEQGARVGGGDILLVRTGHAPRRAALGPWDAANAKAGLHPTVMPFLAERGIAALGSDGNSDTAPSAVDGVPFPVHVLAINAMGLHLLDYLQFEDLRAACEPLGRWEFLLVAAPLRIPRGTGSPLNPIAIL